MRNAIILLVILILSSCHHHDATIQRAIEFGSTASTGAEDVKTVLLTITVNQIDPTKLTSVNYSVTGGTATGNGVDYTLNSGTATIADSTTFTTIAITVVNDYVTEPNETIIVSLSNPVNCILGANVTYTYTITDNPVDKSLVFYLPFNGNVKDSSIYQNSNIFKNITFGNDQLGHASHAGVFNATTTYLQYQNSESIDTLTRLTLAAWILPVSFYGTGGNPIIHKASSDVNNNGNPLPYFQYHLGLTGDQYWHYQGSISFSLSINGEFVNCVSPNSTWVAGQWMHIAATYDGVNMKLYVNGVLNTTVNSPGDLGRYGRPLYIGKEELQNDTPHQLPGTFDEIRIYSRAMTADQVSALYQLAH